MTKKIKIEDGEDIWIGGTQFTLSEGNLIYQGTNDDMYYDGHIVEHDMEHGYYYEIEIGEEEEE